MLDKAIFELPGIKGHLLGCFLLAVLRSLFVIGQAVSLSIAIVGVWTGGTVASQLPMLAAFASCFVLREALRAIQEKRCERYAHAMTARLRLELLGCIYDNGEGLLASFGSAWLVTEAVEGMANIERYLATIVPRTVSLVTVPLCLVIAVFTQDVVSGIIVLVCYPFIIAFMRLIGHSAADESAKRHEGFVAMSGHFLDSLRGMSTLKAFGVSKPYAKTIFAASERYRELIMKTLRIAMLSGAVLDIFATCGLAAVAIMLGFRMVEGTLAFLPALIVLMLVPEYFLPIRRYAADYHASLDGKTALAALDEILSSKPRRVNLGIALDVPEGSHIALMGRSGSGKTTLLNVVAGLLECDAPEVSVAGVSGSGFHSPEWQARVAYIRQDPYVFTGTIRENVTLFKPDAADEEVMSALEMVGMADVVDSMPYGLDTVIGHGGRQLSGGQAHRVALARALVDPARDVWLLDEPGSNLDSETEMELKAAMLPLMQGRTVIVSTHRDHWKSDLDAVAVIEASDVQAGERVA